MPSAPVDLGDHREQRAERTKSARQREREETLVEAHTAPLRARIAELESEIAGLITTPDERYYRAFYQAARRRAEAAEETLAGIRRFLQ